MKCSSQIPDQGLFWAICGPDSTSYDGPVSRESIATEISRPVRGLVTVNGNSVGLPEV